MGFTRREAIILGAGAATCLYAGLQPLAVLAGPDEAAKLISEFAGGKEPQSGRVTLKAPEIAENGNTVPVSVTVDSPMTDADYVAAVMLVAENNPNPGVATFNFTPMSGAAEASTRMRLAKTQNVIAVARMNDGSVFMDKREVKVTIGGCGG